MVKVLIYSSKEIYDNASYEGRAEAHVIAYRINELEYYVVKNRYSSVWMSDYNISKPICTWHLRRHIETLERDEWQSDLDAFNLQVAELNKK